MTMRFKKIHNYTVINKDMIKLTDVQTGCYALILRWKKPNGDGYINDLTQQQMADKLGVTEKTVRNADLEKFLTELGIEARPTKGQLHWRYNYYINKHTDENYFFVSNDYFDEIDTLGYKKWVFLLKMKALCLNGTNDLLTNTLKLSKTLQASRTVVTKMIKELIEDGQIEEIKTEKGAHKGWRIINKNIYDNSELYDGGIYSDYFKLFKEYCESKDSRFLFNIADKKQRYYLGVLIAKYGTNGKQLLSQLNERLETLPKEVSINYFIAVLTGYNTNKLDLINTSAIKKNVQIIL